MDEMRNDAELREWFAALRMEEAGTAPPFRAPERRPAPRRLPIGLTAAATVAIAAVGGIWLSRGPDPDALTALGIDLNETTWTSPTDFLLNTPGAEFFGDLPTLFRLDSIAGPTEGSAPAQPGMPEELS